MNPKQLLIWLVFISLAVHLGYFLIVILMLSIFITSGYSLIRSFKQASNEQNNLHN